MTDPAWVTCAGSSHTSVSLAVTGDQAAANSQLFCSQGCQHHTSEKSYHIHQYLHWPSQSGLRTIFFKYTMEDFMLEPSLFCIRWNKTFTDMKKKTFYFSVELRYWTMMEREYWQSITTKPNFPLSKTRKSLRSFYSGRQWRPPTRSSCSRGWPSCTGPAWTSSATWWAPLTRTSSFCCQLWTASSRV